MGEETEIKDYIKSNYKVKLESDLETKDVSADKVKNCKRLNFEDEKKTVEQINYEKLKAEYEKEVNERKNREIELEEKKKELAEGRLKLDLKQKELDEASNEVLDRRYSTIKKYLDSFTEEEKSKNTYRILFIIGAFMILLLQYVVICVFIWNIISLTKQSSISSEMLTSLTTLFSVFTGATIAETYLVIKQISQYLFANNYKDKLDLIKEFIK